MATFLTKFYNKTILDYPKTWLALIAVIVGLMGFHISNFKLDASADTLVLENDEDLRYYRSISKVYKNEDFLVITYTPYEDLMSRESLEGIKSLKEDLLKLDRVESVVSILDVPLFNSPRITLSDLDGEIRTLQTEDTDRSLTHKEFTESPIYRKLLVSPDGKTTAILANYKRDEK